MIPGAKKTVNVLYFARLREERGLSQESIETFSCTPRQLYEELRSCHGLSLSLKELRVAVNNHFSSWDTVMKSNDQVVFIPPVSGG